MRGLPTAIALEIGKDYAKFCYLIFMDLAAPQYFTNLDFNAKWKGHTYESRGINLNNIHTSLSTSIDKTSFDIDNTDKTMSALVLGNDTRGRNCIIYLAAVDNYGDVQDADPVFVGMLDSVTVDNRKATFDVYSHMVLWKKKTPRRIHQGTCAWVFKDSVTCRYAGGETWCDHSYNRCVALANSDNFGGFRFLPSLKEKELWWGQKS